jgi:hypothetical protein
LKIAVILTSAAAVGIIPMGGTILISMSNVLGSDVDFEIEKNLGASRKTAGSSKLVCILFICYMIKEVQG